MIFTKSPNHCIVRAIMGNIKIIDRREDNSEDIPDETKEPLIDSDAVFNLNTRTGSEIINILAEGNRKNILTSILSAIGRISENTNLDDALKTYNLDQLWELITSPPWVKAYIEPLKKEIARRFQENPNLSVSDAISNIEINFGLKPGFIVVADLNGYSNFQYQATDFQKAALDENYQRIMFGLCQRFIVKLLQAPAGDAYVFYIEEHLPAFLKALKEVQIKVPLGSPDKALYPDGNFTFSTGIAEADGDLKLSLYTSPKGIEDGLIDVDGPAYVRAITGQKRVGKNRMEIDNETRNYLIEEGIKINGAEIKNEHLADVKIPKINDAKYIYDTSSPSGEKYITLIKESLPNTYKESVALIAALAQASHPRGCISTIDIKKRGKESSPNALNLTSIAFKIGSLEELGMRQERYSAVIKKYFKLRENYPDFFTFKKDGEKLLVHTRLPLNEENGKKILSFCRDMANMISNEGFQLGIGIGYTESMVRTRVLGSSLEERAGSGIVKSVRLGSESSDLRIDTEFCRKAFGNIFEFETVKAKGGDIMCLKIALDNIDPNNISGKNLVGVDKEKEEIEEFISNLGNNGNFLKIHSNLSGAGVSALMRYCLKKSAEKGVKASSIEKIGQDSYSLIRGLVFHFYPEFKNELNESKLLEQFDKLILDSKALNETNLLVLDIKEINPSERPLFERFAAAIVTTKTALIHSGDFGGKSIEVKAMNLEDATDMLMDINTINLDLITDLQPLHAALQKFCDEENIHITPRNLIYILNGALTKEGGRIFFDKNKSKNVKTGEIGRKITEEVSEERQFILGLVASVKFKTNAKILWTIYCKLKNIPINNSEIKEIFMNDLEYLTDKTLLEKIDGTYDLKDKNERSSAMLLAVKDETEFSRMLILEKAFEGEEIDSLEAKFQHLLNAGAVKEQSLIISCSKVANYYCDHGFISEARRSYSSYLNKSGLSQIKPENFDFFMAMAQTFHTSDENDRKIAEEIYSKIESIDSSEAIKLKLIWRKYRLCTLDSKNARVPDEVVKLRKTSFDENQLDGIFETRKRQAIFKELINELNTLPNSDMRNSIITTIEMDNLLRKVYVLRAFNDERVKKDELKDYYLKKKLEFKTELEELIQKSGKGTEEINATFLRLCGGTSNQLGNHQEAISIFIESLSKFAALNPADVFQMNDTQQGAVEASDYLCREKASSETASREDIITQVTQLELRVKKLEESAILNGDIINRANAMLGYCDVCIYKIKAIGKAPNLDSDKSLVLKIIEENTHFADNYVKLMMHQNKGAGKVDIMNKYEQVKIDLNDSVRLLPAELRN